MEPPTRTTCSLVQRCANPTNSITYLVDVFLLDISILENLLNGFHGLAEKVHVKLLELGPGKRLGEVISILERFNLDPGRLLARQSTFGLFNLALQLAHGAQVGGDISTRLLLVKFDKVVNDPVVEIFTTKVSVTGGRKDLKDTVLDGEKRDIKGTTTKVVDDDLRFTVLLVKTIGNGSGSRLVDDTKNLKASNSPSIFGCLTLGVIEV